MSKKWLKMLIERLKDYEPLIKINMEGNELYEKEFRIMKENEEIFDCLEELSISLKEKIDKSELKSFLNTFYSIGKIKLNGIKGEHTQVQESQENITQTKKEEVIQKKKRKTKVFSNILVCIISILLLKYFFFVWDDK